MKSEAMLIEAIIRGVEDFLERHQLSMTSGRKALLVRMLFTHLRDRAALFSADEVEELLDSYWLEVERSLQRELITRAAASSLH